MESDADRYRNYVLAVVEHGTVEEVERVWQESFAYGEVGAIARAFISKNIYNVADRFDLLEPRLTIQQLAARARRQKFFAQLLRGDARSLLSYFFEGKASIDDVSSLIAALQQGSLQSARDLAKVVYILAMYRETQQKELLQVVVQNPALYLVNNNKSSPVKERLVQTRKLFLNELANIIRQFQNIKGLRALKEIFDAQSWSYLTERIGYDPVLAFEKSKEEVNMTEVAQEKPSVQKRTTDDKGKEKERSEEENENSSASEGEED